MKMKRKNGEVKDEERRRHIREAAIAFSAGWMMVGAMAVGGYLGYLLDRNLGTEMVFMAVGIMLGSIGALWELYRMLNRGVKR